MKKLFGIFMSIALIVSMAACSSDSSEGIYTAGEYEAVAHGRNSDFTVIVTFSDNAIESVEIPEHEETQGIGTAATDAIPGMIVDAQSTDIDVISGATITSNAIIDAVNDCIVQAGGSSAAAELEKGEDIDCDVVIVGGGLAGMMASLEFEDINPDLKVVMIEDDSTLGGDLPMSVGGIMAFTNDYAGTDTYVAPTAEQYLSYYNTFYQANLADGYATEDNSPNEALILNVYSDTLTDCMENMFEAGVPFAEDLTGAGSSVYSDIRNVGAGDGNFGIDRWFTANAFNDALIGAVEKTNVTVLMNTEAVELIADGNRVTGVVVNDETSEYTINADYVILACGGIGDNSELMNEYNYPFEGAMEASAGGGHGWSIIATRQFDTPVIGYGVLGNVSANDKTFHILSARFYVGADGNRFTNESDRSQRALYDSFTKSTGSVWSLYDSTFAAANQETVDFKLGEGNTFVYDSLEELAEGEGINYENLAATVEKYNAAVDAGETLEFGLSPENANKLETAPYYVERLNFLGFETFPGLKVNENTQVVTGSGDVVENLFAVGQTSIANVIDGVYGQGGTGLTWAAASGTYAASYIANIGK